MTADVFFDLTDSFTRPADTTVYTSGDLVANSTTAGSVVPLQWKVPTGYGKHVKIVGVTVQTDDTTVTNQSFTLWVYKDSPTTTAGDNAALEGATPAASFEGKLATGQLVGFSDGAKALNFVDDADAIRFNVDNDGLIYGLLEINANYTPTSGETFTVGIEVVVER